MQATGPIHDVVSANLGAKVSVFMHDRLMRACVGPPGLGHLEYPDARRRSLGSARLRPRPHRSEHHRLDAEHRRRLRTVRRRCRATVVALRVPLVGAAAARRGVGQHAPLPPQAADLARTHLRRGRREATARRVRVQAHGRIARVKGGAAVRAGRLDRRRLHVVATPPPRPVVGGAAAAARAPRSGRSSSSPSPTSLFFWSLGRDASNGDIGVGALVVFAQAAIGASAVAFGDWDWWLRTSCAAGPDRARPRRRMAPAGALAAGPAEAGRRNAAREIRFDGVRFALPDERSPRARRLRPHDPGRALARDRRPERRGQDDAGQAAVPHVRPDRRARSASTASTCARSISRRGGRGSPRCSRTTCATS